MQCDVMEWMVKSVIACKIRPTERETEQNKSTNNASEFGYGILIRRSVTNSSNLREMQNHYHKSKLQIFVIAFSSSTDEVVLISTRNVFQFECTYGTMYV